ncbi:uncharacterized protein L199_001262 [Kwoniella botswanensis]|uniref:uncharacterized protein n=1 Tax=Kwoniella botswanensis TaxID=1268659 RepID=UPI00315CD4BC
MVTRYTYTAPSKVLTSPENTETSQNSKATAGAEAARTAPSHSSIDPPEERLLKVYEASQAARDYFRSNANNPNLHTKDRTASLVGLDILESRNSLEELTPEQYKEHIQTFYDGSGMGQKGIYPTTAQYEDYMEGLWREFYFRTKKTNDMSKDGNFRTFISYTAGLEEDDPYVTNQDKLAEDEPYVGLTRRQLLRDTLLTRRITLFEQDLQTKKDWLIDRYQERWEDIVYLRKNRLPGHFGKSAQLV